VAQRLHLAPRQIIALEEGDFANLPGPTYVRGYLRSYAELVGLKPEHILADYANLSGGQKKSPVLTGIAPKEEITSQHHQVKFTTYVVVTITLALAFMWWQGREDEPARPAYEVASSAPGDSEGQSPAGTAEGVTPDSAEAPLTSPADGGALMPVAPAAPAAAVATPAPVVPPPALAPAVQQVVPATSPAAQPAAVARVETRAAAPAVPEKRASLVLYAENECWVDVRDAHQNKLLYETVPAGRRVVLDGVVPFNVFLGNVAGVKVEFNGKPYDAMRHQRGLVARFTLGNELVQPAAVAADR
jgi:cytoskeleton protein RodZ